MLVVFRNPKDTLVSYYHFYNNNPVLPKTESWDSFYTDFMKGEGDSPLFFGLKQQQIHTEAYCCGLKKTN